MKKYILNDIKAFGIGIATYWMIFMAIKLSDYVLVATGVIHVDISNITGTESWNWSPWLIIATVLHVLLLTLPGYLTGRSSTQNSSMNGVLVILCCNTLQYMIFSIYWEYVFVTIVPVLRYIEQLVLPVTIGAVSGAAGQYHGQHNKHTDR